MQIPTGIITFLFTDIEGSTKRWEQYPDAMRVALAWHDALLRHAIETHNGYVFKTVGDAFCAAFSSAIEAVQAARDAQLALESENWDEIGGLRVRMGLHTGAAEERDGDYFGPTVNRVARLQSLASGQQMLLSQTTVDLCTTQLPADLTLHDLGQHWLKDLQQPEQVWQLQHPHLPQSFPAIRSLRAFPNNLPQQLTSFIGREEDVRAIKRSLTGTTAEREQNSATQTRTPATRLLTLMGSGGIGKTRLAIQSAAELIESFPDGVWLIELAPVTDETLLVQTVAGTLGLREEPGISLQQAVLDYCRPKRVLLLLDNCEHLVVAVAQFADRLLRHCPTVSVLATSREALGIAGETRYRVPSLSLPNPDRPPSVTRLLNCTAVQLFVERATAVRSDFQLTPDNSLAVAQICRRLDGIPLATELAAARTRAMHISQLASRLEESFQLLTGGSRTVLPRHQTLRALIDWSYRLLTVSEQRLFARLSVFAGGWTLEAAEAICAGEIDVAGGHEILKQAKVRQEKREQETLEIADYEVLDLLTSLSDKSLVIYEEEGASGRYRMLETLRQYGRERLAEFGEQVPLQTRHCDYFRQFMSDTLPKLLGAEQNSYLARLATERNNLRTALSHYETLRSTSALAPEEGERWLEMVCNLTRFWYIRGPISEGREWFEKAIEATPQTANSLLARAHNNAGLLANLQGDRNAARKHHLASLGIARSYEHAADIARSLNNLALVEEANGDYVGMSTYLEECLPIYRSLNARREAAIALANLGLAMLHRQEVVLATEYFMESLLLLRKLNDSPYIASVLEHLGEIAIERNELDQARCYLVECLRLRSAQGNTSGLAFCLENFASLALRQQQYSQATSYLGTAEAHRQSSGRQRTAIVAAKFERNLTLARDQLGEELFAETWHHGYTRTIEEAIAELEGQHKDA